MTNRFASIIGKEALLANSVRAVLALVLLAPLVVTASPWPETLFLFVVGKALWTRSLIEVAFGLWIILIIRNPAYCPPKHWLLGLFGLYLFLALLAGVFGASLTRSLWGTFERMGGWVALAHWFVFVLVLISVFRTWTQWRALLNFNIGVSVAIGLLGLSEYFEWGWLSYLKLEDNRVSSTLGNPTYLGGYAAVNAFIAVAFLVSSFIKRTQTEGEAPQGSRQGRRAQWQSRPLAETGRFSALFAPVSLWRLFWLAAISLDLTMLWLSASRGGLAGLVAGLIAFGLAYSFWGYSRRWRRAAATATVLALLLVAVTALLLFGSGNGAGQGEDAAERNSGMLGRLFDFGLTEGSSIEGRVAASRVGLDGFLDRPILGWGPENFNIAYTRHISAELSTRGYREFDHAHNKVVEELATKGILGTLVYLAIWLYLLVVFVRKAPFLDSAKRLFTALMGAGLVAYFVQNLFLFDTPGTLPQLLALMGFAVFIDSLPLREKEMDSDRAAACAPFEYAAARLSTPFGPLAVWLRPRLAEAGRRAGAAASFIGLTGLVGIGFMALLVGCMVFFLNVRVYSASHWASLTLRPDLSGNEMLYSFQKSVDFFPPLGNQMRVQVFQAIASEWDNLEGEDSEQIEQVLKLVELQGARAIAAEPENWRLYLTIAEVNQRASAIYPERLAEARELVNRAVELAPNRFETQRLLAVQLMLEGDPEGGLQVIDRYLAETPEAARRLERVQATLMTAIEEKSVGKPDAEQ